MARKVSDCRVAPSDAHCSLVIIGEEDEVLKAAIDHVTSVHGHEDSSELREDIRKSLKDESEFLAQEGKRAGKAA